MVSNMVFLFHYGRRRTPVMVGLGPTIHDFLVATTQVVDARHKAWHDGGEWIAGVKTNVPFPHRAMKARLRRLAGACVSIAQARDSASTWSSLAPPGKPRSSSMKAWFQSPRSNAMRPSATAAAAGAARVSLLPLSRLATTR